MNTLLMATAQPVLLPRPAARRLAAAGMLAALLACVFLLHGYWAFKIGMVLVFALAVRGLQLLIGSSGQISLGHGAFFAIGAYAAGILQAQDWAPPCLAIPMAALVCGAAGALFGMPAVRLAGPYLALATFALAVALPQLLKHPALEPWTGGVSGLSLDAVDAPALLSRLDQDQWMLLLAVAWTALAYTAIARLLAGPAGLAWLTLRDHPTAAAATGVNVRKWKIAAFAVSAATVGMAGAINTAATRFVSPDSFTIFLSLLLLVGVAIAGPRSAWGSLVAALFLAFVPDLADRISQEMTGVIYGAIMLGCVYILPACRRLGARASRARINQERESTHNAVEQ